MCKSKLFGAKKSQNDVSAQTEGGGGSIFCDFVRTSFMDGLLL